MIANGGPAVDSGGTDKRMVALGAALAVGRL
jgi:hypothetical protein